MMRAHTTQCVAAEYSDAIVSHGGAVDPVLPVPDCVVCAGV